MSTAIPIYEACEVCLLPIRRSPYRRSVWVHAVGRVGHRAVPPVLDREVHDA